jgi:Gas vesicle protein
VPPKLPVRPRRPPPPRSPGLAAALVGARDPEPSLLDLVDSLLHKGVVVDAEFVIALADVDLLYVRLGALVGAVDRIFGAAPAPRVKPRRRRR